jgi:hypothetical protein
MCGVRWQNGMHFGARNSLCDECEAAFDRMMKRNAKQKAAVAAAKLERIKTYV